MLGVKMDDMSNKAAKIPAVCGCVVLLDKKFTSTFKPFFVPNFL